MLLEHAKEKEAQAQWDTEHWEGETYINKSVRPSGHQKGQAGPRDNVQDLPGHRYNLKLILDISTMAVVLLLRLLIETMCFIQMCFPREAKGADEERPARGLFGW